MKVVKISGAAGAGKSEVLNAIAAVYGGEVVPANYVISAMPLLMKKLSALNANTFIDEARPVDVVKLEKLAKLYPDTYHMYIVEGS